MLKIPKMQPEKKSLQEYQKILDDIDKNASETFPELLEEIRIIDDNKIISDGYAHYQYILNQTKIVTTSNHVG
jgi:hypothetical protein